MPPGGRRRGPAGSWPVVTCGGVYTATPKKVAARERRSRAVECEPVIDPDLVRDVLQAALAGGARFAEVFAEERSSTVIRLDGGRVEEVVAGTDRGAGVRVFHGESQAYAYTNRLEAESLRDAAAAAASAGRGATERVTVAGLTAGPPVRHDVRIAGADVPRDRKVAWLRSQGYAK